jgi:hypothetical protein
MAGTTDIRVASWGVVLLLAISPATRAQEPFGSVYAMGNPTVSNLWVDPVHGDDGHSGASSNAALRTISEAWARIPSYTPFTTNGYRIRLMPGDYAQTNIPSWWEARYGSYTCPVILEAVAGRGTSRLHGYPDVFDCRYFYFINIDIVADPGGGGGGNILHLASCDHILIRGCRLDGFDGSVNQPQETLKVNQVQYIYVEDCDISGAFWYPLDFMVVQYGHIRGCRIFNAGEWCGLIKGGSAYITVEENEFYDGATGGFIAGNGSGFEFMVNPWLHYEVYDLKFVNNVIHDTGRAGMGVNGGYNVLLAHNTLYRVGTNDHLIEVLQGYRACNGIVSACISNNAAGGWGNTNLEESQYIPCRNVYIYNNLIYNPTGFATVWQHFSISGPATPPVDANVPNPSLADDNLRIQGNLIWNGDTNMPLGVEDPDSGGQPGNPTCNATQLVADNVINVIEPQLIDPAHGDWRPNPTGNVFSVRTFPIPDFAGGDRASPPSSPPGNLTNNVTRSATGWPRYRTKPPGAYTGGSSMQLQIAGTSNNATRIRLLGEPGYHYRLDGSSNLIQWQWSSIAVTNPASATNDFVDPAGSMQHRFYRSVLLL